MASSPFLIFCLTTNNDLSIISLEGKVLYRDIMYESEMVKNFDLSYFNPGMYVLLLSSNVNHLYNKFLKL